MRNIDARRRARSSSIIGTELGDLRAGGSPTNFQKGVVIDVLNDPALRDRTDSPFSQLRVSNPQYLQIAPRNSIAVKLIGGGQAKQDDTAVICFPFFPPHICMPVNAGETVWIFSESGTGDNPLLYWVSRVPEPVAVDDLNYTHSDRRFEAPAPRRLSDRVRQEETGAGELTFPNGAGTTDGGTLSGGNDAYDQLVSRSVAYSNSVKEAVPRYTKRPGDLILQGTNNTLISLGTDRGPRSGGTTGEASSAMVASTPDSTMQQELRGTGTIDIVAGRGQAPDTAAPIATNTRGFEEVDKRPTADINPREGDPEFVSDASRVYISMRTDGDSNFGLEPAGGEPQINDAAFVVAKSDNARLVGRNTVRLVAEGGNQATVQMVDGKIRIETAGSFVQIDTDEVRVEAVRPVNVQSTVSANVEAPVINVTGTTTVNMEAPVISVTGTTTVTVTGATTVNGAATVTGPVTVTGLATLSGGLVAGPISAPPGVPVTLSGVDVVAALGAIRTAFAAAPPDTGLPAFADLLPS